MTLYDLIVSRRTIRLFQNKKIERSILEKLVNAGRLAPSAANKQPLEYIIVDDENVCNDIFQNIKLAGSVNLNPSNEYQPRAYIAILCNTEIQTGKWMYFDSACSAENICLAGLDANIGSCMVGAFDEKNVRNTLGVTEKFEIPLLIALGYSAHESKIEDSVDGNIKYRKDENNNFYIPKRLLKDIIHYNSY